MHKRVRRKLIQKVAFGVVLCGIVGVIAGALFLRPAHQFVQSSDMHHIVINDDGRKTDLRDVPAKTVADVLAYYDPSIGERDRVFPARDMAVFDDDVITIDRDHVVTVEVDDNKKEIHTFRDNLLQAIIRGGVTIAKDDIVKPAKDVVVYGDMEATIIRVIIKEETVTKKIPFKTEENEDDTVNFLKRFTKQKGENGAKEIIYEVAYHNGEEVARDVKSETVTKEPVTEIVVQGTKVVVGKKHTGACSWYAHTGTLSAANPWMPIGSYARVTNQENGKSVIVRINDRGPFVAGRIIDLDKVAFEKIASLGAGVINVKMEEIIND
ncbi:MAG: G5 domain-containing protein [Parcubacteria group bacterium]|jgi:uncharacterized protein YabE (DUF348 family)